LIAHPNDQLRHARNLPAILLEMVEVTEDEDFGRAWRIEPVIYDQVTSMVEIHFGRRAEQAAQRRGLHTGGPQVRRRGISSNNSG
jgi:hypothetical protein